MACQRRKRHTQTAVKAVKTLVGGLTQFFDDALPRCLLYRFERGQYDSFFSKNSSTAKGAMRPSAVYGAEHLLRLFVKLPALLEEAGTTEDDRAYFEPQINGILKFLQKGSASATYFLKDYEPASEDYLKLLERSGG